MKTDELLLSWRHPQEEEDRSRYVIGRLRRDVDGFTFVYSDDFERAVQSGFTVFPGFDDTTMLYRSLDLFPNIVARLPSQDKADYLDVLNMYNLSLGATDWEVLLATRGRLITDNFEFVPVFNRDKIEFDVAGVRHHKKEVKQLREYLKVNAKVLLEPEPDNVYDKHAIKVILPVNGEKICIGYVPRYYSRQLFGLIHENKKYSALVSKVNIDAMNFDEQIAVKVRLLLGNNA